MFALSMPLMRYAVDALSMEHLANKLNEPWIKSYRPPLWKILAGHDATQWSSEWRRPVGESNDFLRLSLMSICVRQE